MNNKKGFVLVTALLTTCVLIAIALPYVARVANEYKMTSKMFNSILAVDLAEAGADRGIWEICHGTYAGWAYTNYAGNKTWTISNVPFSNVNGNTIGYYDVTVYLPNGTTTETITSISYIPNKTSWDETKKVVVTYAGGQYYYTSAIAAAGNNGSITMSGQAKTDSYDSTIGPYNSPLQTNKNHGSIQSNGAINFSGQAYINGNANPGPGHPFSGHPPVSGSYATLAAPINVSPVVIDKTRTYDNANITITHNGKVTPYTGGNVLSVSGQDTLTLPGGAYYFTSVSISGQAAVIVGGTSLIYVDGGSVSVSGQGIVNNGSPLNLGIYTTGSSVSLSGQAAYVGTIYGPNTTVTLSGQENLYGSIVCGSSVDTGQAAIHYDLALANANHAPQNYGTRTWMEQ